MRPTAAQDPFQFTSSPVPMASVSTINWYGNINFAFENPGYYTELQGMHSGVDFLMPIGTPITSTVNRSGTVISINNSPPAYQAGPGNVAVDYGDFIVLYGHTMQSPPDGKTVPGLGDSVAPGSVVAYSGKDRYGTKHLHLELIIKDPVACDPRPGCRRTNPVPFFSQALHDQMQDKQQHPASDFHQWPDCPQWLTEHDQPDITPGGDRLVGCDPRTWNPGVDVALIIDSSGSMQDNDPTDRRLAAARAYLTASLPGDRVAVVDFATTARLASGLRRVPDGRAALLSAIASIGSGGGSTNIADAIGRACTELASHGVSSTRRGAILLTDGLHNEGPWDDPQQCFANHRWPIFTFGFGDADLALLAGIAEQTGGRSTSISDVTDLVCGFQAVRMRLGGQTPGDCTSSHVAPSSTTRVSRTVPDGQSRATFSSTWTGSDIVMTLVSPSGRTITRATRASDVTHDRGDAFEVYSIVRPEPGTWRIRLYGADVPPGGEDTVLGFTTIPAPPVARRPTVGVALHTSVSGRRIPLLIRWGVRSAGAGIDAVLLGSSSDAGRTWSTPATLGAARRQLVRKLAAGPSGYRFRVALRDTTGFTSRWATSATVRVGLAEDASAGLRFSGRWTAEPWIAATDGVIHTTSQPGASVRYTFTGRGIAFLAAPTLDKGRARVLIDGKRVAVVDLGDITADSSSRSEAMFARSWSASGKHTIEIVNLATAGRPEIDIDAFVVLR